MKEDTNIRWTHVAIAMAKAFPNAYKIIKVKIRHEDEINKYVEEIKEAHKNAAKSTLSY